MPFFFIQRSVFWHPFLSEKGDPLDRGTEKGVDTLSLFRLDPITILIRALVLVTAMPVHECAHGWVADKLGDHTARAAGRLTLNPFHHLDPFGSVLLLLAGFGWAKPVPVNPYYFTKIHNRKAGVALTALAGPVSNILMALVALFVAKGIMFLPSTNRAVSMLFTIFLIVCQTNLGLAIFNLIPIHPLDGSRVLDFFLPYKATAWIEEHEQIIYIVFMVVILFTPILDWPLTVASNWLFQLLDRMTALVLGF